MRAMLPMLLLWALLLAAPRPQEPNRPDQLNNPGFEGAGNAFLSGWGIFTYGDAPLLYADFDTYKEGKSSLHVAAKKLTDTAISQEVVLKAGHLYRFTGWVRTHGLDPHGAPVYGTFQIQQHDGHGIIASGPNHGGDTDWTQVPIFFQAPPGGVTRISLFFVGFGKGTGDAWFDDLRLEEVNTAMSTIAVTREPLHAGTISPFQYGQFIEYLCTLVPGMWAEKLYDGSFEGLTPYRFAFIAQTDNKEKPWYPSGAVNRAEYTHDHETRVSGEVSQRIRVPGDAPCTVGISQDGIAVEREHPCRFRIWLRAADLHGSVHVTLAQAGKELASCALQPDGDWKSYTATLTPTATATEATLTIAFTGPGTLWLDNASLMPVDTVGGWRRDVVEALRALHPGIIRFGGSAVDDKNLGEFEWREAVGDVDHRKPFRAWGGLQPTGAGLEEIVQLCYAVGAEPLICVRTSGRMAQDAADEVQYFNGAVDTPLGAQRAKNGHPQPYHIRYWQVGNERAGNEYETKLSQFCKAMRAADPTIKLLSSYPTPGVLQSAGDLLDFVCPHQYDCADLNGTRQELEETRRLIAEKAPGHAIKVGVTEWNTTGGDWGLGRAKLWTLENALACARYQNLLHRECDLVEIANRSNLTNSFCSGILQTDNHRLYKTPTYYAQQLYATLAGTRPLRLASDLPTDLAPDISATLSTHGDAVTLFVINSSLQETTRTLDMSAFGHQGQEAEVWTLTDRERAGSPDVTNSFDDPERIAPVHSTFHAPSAKFTCRFSPLSLTVLRWKVTPAPH